MIRRCFHTTDDQDVLIKHKKLISWFAENSLCTEIEEDDNGQSLFAVIDCSEKLLSSEFETPENNNDDFVGFFFLCHGHIHCLESCIYLYDGQFGCVISCGCIMLNCDACDPHLHLHNDINEFGSYKCYGSPQLNQKSGLLITYCIKMVLN